MEGKRKRKISPYLFAPPEMVTQKNEISTIRNIWYVKRKQKEPIRAENEKHKKAARKKLCKESNFLPSVQLL